MNARLPALSLALLLLPGCYFTGELWDWAEDDGYMVDAWPEQIVGSTARTGAALDDEGFDVHVRWTDGSSSTERVGLENDGSPADLVAAARAHARGHDPAQAAWLLRLATTRGWPRRDFADDPAFTTVRGEADFATACAAPVTSPTFFLGPPPRGTDGRTERRDLWLRGTADELRIVELQPRTHYEDSRGGPLGYLVALVATPVTLALDVVTFPGQVILVVLIGRALGGVGTHTQ
jgi:hypothetical protein